MTAHPKRVPDVTRRRRRAVLAVGVAVTILAVAVPAVAQDPSPAERAAARRLFGEGMRAARSGDWERARDRFARSYEVVQRPKILLNLASAQKETGQLVEAAESYRTFLRIVDPGSPAAHFREGTQQELEALEARIAHLRISIDNLERTDRVLMDGEELGRAVLEVDLPANPGSHALTVERGGEEIASEMFELDEGEDRELSLSVQPAPDPAEAPSPEQTAAAASAGTSLAASAPAAAQDEPSGSVLTSPWLWTAVGAVVLGGVVAAVLLAVDSGPDRRRGNFGPGRVVVE